MTPEETASALAERLSVIQESSVLVAPEEYFALCEYLGDAAIPGLQKTGIEFVFFCGHRVFLHFPSEAPQET